MISATPSTQAPTPALYTIPEAAERLRCSVKTIRRRIADGTIEAVRLGPRLLRVVLPDDLTSLGEPVGWAGKR